MTIRRALRVNCRCVSEWLTRRKKVFRFGAVLDWVLDGAGKARENGEEEDDLDVVVENEEEEQSAIVTIAEETAPRALERGFMRGLINIVFDEAHVIQDWGGTFRPEYMKLGPLRYTMARRIPYHLGTATLSPSSEASLKTHLSLGDTETIRLDTDRKNIFYRVQKMKYPVNSYRDLAALVSVKPNSPAPKKFLLFFKSRKAAQEGATFLRSRLPKEKIEMVKWVHSG